MIVEAVKYKYTLEKDYSFSAYLAPNEAKEWKAFIAKVGEKVLGSISLTRNGELSYLVIKINKGYSWDGCSPNWRIGKFVFGTPDGKIDKITGKPITYYPSLVHDFLYQFKKEHGVSRITADTLFYSQLATAGFCCPLLYYVGVRVGGGLYGEWKAH